MTSYGDNDDPSTWLVTPEQASVLQCTESLLHIQGPPGSGKSLLLLDRVRRWLSRGHTVVLAVSGPSYELLLHRLGRAIVKSLSKATTRALILCVNVKEFRKTIGSLRRQVPPPTTCLAVDDMEGEFLPVLLDAYRSFTVLRVWITSQSDLGTAPDFRRVCLPHSLRFSDVILDLARKLLPNESNFAARTDWCCLPSRRPSNPVKLGLHSSHARCESVSPPGFDCKDCDEWLQHSLAPLRTGVTAEWRRWVVLLTGNWGSKTKLSENLREWLKVQGVPAVFEWQSDTRVSTLDVASFPSQGESHEANDERAALRSRVESGESKDSRPAVHVMRGSHFRGLEKPCILVVHYDASDGLDEQPEAQSTRLSKHCRELFRAMTCCREDLAILFLSSSPAVHQLQKENPCAVEEVDETTV